MVKKFEPEIVKIDKIVYGGQGLGELSDGRKVFVWGALPGETVRVEIIKSKKSYAEGVAIEVVESSPHRIKPRDECYLSTSPWQIMDFDYEQEWKGRLVGEIFARSIAPITDNNDYHYRNKMEYSLWWDHDTGKISLAFHKRGSHQKIPITRSSIERPEIFAEAMRIVDELNARGEEARKYQMLLVRANQRGEVSSALFENGKSHPVMKTLTDTLCGYEYSYSPNGFFQINLPIYEMALNEIARFITTEKVVDMYSGVGTIGLSVARDRELTLVETNSSAFREMVANTGYVIASGAKQSSLDRHVANAPRDDGIVTHDNITAVCAKSEDALEYITHDATLILDPPRAGLDERVVARILESTPPCVIYLSCNPATQARDVEKLLTKYKIAHTQPFNFFPRTPHIENLIILNLR